MRADWYRVVALHAPKLARTTSRYTPTSSVGEISALAMPVEMLYSSDGAAIGGRPAGCGRIYSYLAISKTDASVGPSICPSLRPSSTCDNHLSTTYTDRQKIRHRRRRSALSSCCKSLAVYQRTTPRRPLRATYT